MQVVARAKLNLQRTPRATAQVEYCRLPRTSGPITEGKRLGGRFLGSTVSFDGVEWGWLGTIEALNGI